MAWAARSPAITATPTKASTRCHGASVRRKLQTAMARPRIQIPAGPDRMPDTKPATSVTSSAASSTHQGRIHSARTVANSPAIATRVAAGRGSTMGHRGILDRRRHGIAAARPYLLAMRPSTRAFTLAPATSPPWRSPVTPPRRRRSASPAVPSRSSIKAASSSAATTKITEHALDPRRAAQARRCRRRRRSRSRSARSYVQFQIPAEDQGTGLAGDHGARLDAQRRGARVDAGRARGLVPVLRPEGRRHLRRRPGGRVADPASTTRCCTRPAARRSPATRPAPPRCSRTSAASATRRPGRSGSATCCRPGRRSPPADA